VATSALGDNWYHVLSNPTSGRDVHVIGIAYNKTTNAERVYDVLDMLHFDHVRSGPGAPKPRVLMESYNCPTEDVIETGGIIPYTGNFVDTPKGIDRAVLGVQLPDFREKISGEVVGVLQALRFGYDVVFCDRRHWLSVDRLISHNTTTELEERAVRAMNAVLEEANAKKVPPVMAQNALLPAFPELLHERQLVMIDCALKASMDAPTVVIVGGQHAQGIKQHWNAPIDVHELLSAQPTPSDPIELELQKRGLLLALFVTTSAFPGEAVTDSLPEDLPEHHADQLREWFTEYRSQFQRKMLESAVPQQDVMKIMQEGMDAQGLPQLMKLLAYLENAPASF
jgi:hypothetical protein